MSSKRLPYGSSRRIRDLRDNVIAYHMQGMLGKDIAKLVGHHPSYVSRIITRHGRMMEQDADPILWHRYNAQFTRALDKLMIDFESRIIGTEGKAS